MAFAELALVYGATATAGLAQFTLIFFSALFPTGVAGAFFHVLYTRPFVLFAPGDFANSKEMVEVIEALQKAISDKRKIESFVERTMTEKLQAQVANSSDKPAATALSPETVRQLVRETMHSVSGEVITVDTKPITGATGQVLLLPFDGQQTIYSFLSQVYWSMSDRLAAFSYGTTWVLEDTVTGAVYDARSADQRQRLLGTPIVALGLRPGMKLRAVPVTDDTKKRVRLPSAA